MICNFSENGFDSYGDRKVDSDTSSSNTPVDDTEPWPGRWLPEKVEPKHRVVSKRLNDTSIDTRSMTKSINKHCDNGKVNLNFRRLFFFPGFLR